jgi:cell division protein FtsB
MADVKGGVKKNLIGKKYIIAGLAVLVLMTIVFANSYYKNYQLRLEIKSMLDEANKIENDNADLRSLLEKVKSPIYAEQIGRTNLGLIKPGENQVVLIGNLDKYSGQAKSGVVESTKLSNPRQWWNYFFNHN